MLHPSVPVVMGSSSAKTMELPLCHLTEIWFPADAVLEPHTHERGIFAIMLEGSFRTRIGTRTLECTPNRAWTEPREEKHANYVGSGGAHVLVFQPDHTQSEVFAPVERFLNGVYLTDHPTIRAQMYRIAAELRRPDDWSALHIESAMMSMIASAARNAATRETARHVPKWLLQARDLVEANFRKGGFGLRAVANEIRIDAAHLAVTFRRHYGVSLGEYARSLRFEFALQRLTETDSPISAVAINAGYADQSHLTRDFKARLAATPSAVRAGAGRTSHPQSECSQNDTDAGQAAS